MNEWSFSYKVCGEVFIRSSNLHEQILSFAGIYYYYYFFIFFYFLKFINALRCK